MKIILLAVAITGCLAAGCSSIKDNQPTSGGSANKPVSESGNTAQEKAVSVSDGNSSIEVKRGESDSKNKAIISDGKGNVVKVEKSQSDADDADDEETSEVSGESGGSVKSTTRNGRQTSVITGKNGDALRTETDKKSGRTVLTDGKGDKITVGPGGVVLRDPKGNKIIVPH